MKTHKHLYEQICSFDNLLIAAQKAQRGKRFRPGTAAFNFHLERELLTLQREFREQTYRPGPYREFAVYESKRRVISAAPYRDRVVHHALCNVIEPLFERTFVDDSYACRKGRGQHAAVERFTQFCRCNRYVLKCDITKYFPSIDHEILRGLLGRTIADPRALWLIKLIIDSGPEPGRLVACSGGDNPLEPPDGSRGIPIGNLTSQFFANCYLNGFDHWVKEVLRCRHYIRYVDDFVTLDDEKERLHEIKARMAEYLAGLRLTLHEIKCQLFPVEQGTDFLGYRIFPTHRLLRKGNATRFRRRLRRLQEAYRRGQVPFRQIDQSVQSWIGHVKHADTYGLRRAIFGDVTF